MHEDPTRLMGQPEDRGPDGHQPHGNMRLLVACLVAVIVGLVVAVIVFAGNDNGRATASSAEALTTLPGSAETTAPTTTSTAPTTTESTTTETTEPTTTTTAPTTTSTSTTPTTTPEENGSGGIPAP
jgi:cytoskeletal protein RodZ